jgi:hypothetical protein
MLGVVFLIADKTSLTSERMALSTNVCCGIIMSKVASSANHCAQLLIASESLYVWVIIFFKLSLGMFFLRILVERWQRRAVYIILFFASLVGFGYFWYAVFQCGVPDDSYWEKRLNNECSESPRLILAIGYLHAVVNAFTDIALALLPIPVILRSKMSFRDKCVVSGIFTMATM